MGERHRRLGETSDCNADPILIRKKEGRKGRKEGRREGGKEGEDRVCG